MSRSFVASTLFLLGGSIPASCNQPWIAGYTPMTFVNDHAEIDLDQREIEKWLDVGIFQQAERIYSVGAHSQSIARLTLVDAKPPAKPFPVGTLVYGTSTTGNGVQGRIVTETYWNDSTEEIIAFVEYDREKGADHSSHCQVGALAATSSAVKGGCFAGEGKIQVIHYERNTPPYTYKYVYDVDDDNINGRTIESFSTEAFHDMYNCTNCPYEVFNKYFKYYGLPDYGHKAILAALRGEPTGFESGNMNFTGQSRESRSEAIKIATRFFNVWMYVIRMMEYALDQCELPCKKPGNVMYYPAQKAVCDDSPVRAWDQAVAFYAGSLEGESGVGEGLLVFDLADKMCARFLTCGDKAELRFGVSYVNNMIINRFMDGQKHLLKRECDAARKAKNEISKIMAVPLVQATLLNTYEQIYGKERTPEEDAQLEMQGSAYAATLLPLIHDCSPDDAQYIHGSLRFDRGEGNETWMPNYVAIKKVFERNYKCMGITCKAVGGIWEGREYSPYAGPCQDAVEVEEKSLGDNLRIALAVVGVGIALVTIAACCFAYERYKEGRERMYYHDREPSHIPVGNLHASREFD